MQYIVIDTDGALHVRDAPDYRTALKDAGEEGWDMVRLDNARLVSDEVKLAAFVNDCGHIFPDRYARNVVGTCVLTSVGAHPMPYAGPVVFTGWDDYADDVEVRSITDGQVTSLGRIHADVRKVLGLDAGEPSDLAPPNWRAAMTKVAEMARDGQAPSLTFISEPDEVLAALGIHPR